MVKISCQWPLPFPGAASSGTAYYPYWTVKEPGLSAFLRYLHINTSLLRFVLTLNKLENPGNKNNDKSGKNTKNDHCASQLKAIATAAQNQTLAFVLQH